MFYVSLDPFILLFPFSYGVLLSWKHQKVVKRSSHSFNGTAWLRLRISICFLISLVFRCTGADAFVSIGTAKHANYGNKCSAVKIQEVFNYVAAPLVCSTPLDDSTCKLIASDNPLGRLINGVSPKNVCFQKAIDEVSITVHWHCL